jgi:hypothetical protein
MMVQWINGLEEQAGQVRLLMAQVNEGLRNRGLSRADRNRAESMLNNARAAYELVDKARGVHNQPLAESMLSNSIDLLNRAGKLVNPSE